MSVRAPERSQYLLPERPYPALQAGLHVVPLARVEVQPGPGEPFAIGPPALHVVGDHALGGPSVESVPSMRLKAASHAVAPVNMMVV